MDKATADYLVRSLNPYARYGVLDESEWDGPPNGVREAITPRWKAANQFYDSLDACFSTASFRKKPPLTLKEIAREVIGMTPTAQELLYRRLGSRSAGVNFAHNRLGPAELTRFCAELRRMVDDAKVVDGGPA